LCEILNISADDKRFVIGELARHSSRTLPFATERIHPDQENVSRNQISLQICRKTLDVSGDSMTIGVKQSAKLQPAWIVLQVLVKSANASVRILGRN
jgi:hypothetical protein